MSSISTNGYFWLCVLILVPFHCIAVFHDGGFWHPPKPSGDGPDYEAIGYGLSRGLGMATYHSSDDWKGPYFHADPIAYAAIVSREGPVLPDTNRPPLLPAWIASVYTVVPRGPYAFAAVRLSLAVCLAVGSAFFAVWGIKLFQDSGDSWLIGLAPWIPLTLLAIVVSERNFRRYVTDFLTEPIAFLGTALFMLILWQSVQNGRRSYRLLAALLFGILIYCRSAYILWFPGLLLALPVLMRFNFTGVQWSWGQAIGWTSVFAVLVVVTQLPWWIRNAIVLDSYQVLGTKGYTTLLGGYCDDSILVGGEWHGGPEHRLRQKFPPPYHSNEAEDWICYEKEIAYKAQMQAIQWGREHWHRLPGLALRRVVTEWNPYTGKALLLKVLALMGVWCLWRRQRVILFWLLLPLGLNTLLALTTYSLGGRYLVPSYGAFYLLVATGTLFLASLAQSLAQDTHCRSSLTTRLTKDTHC